MSFISNIIYSYSVSDFIYRYFISETDKTKIKQIFEYFDSMILIFRQTKNEKVDILDIINQNIANFNNFKTLIEVDYNFFMTNFINIVTNIVPGLGVPDLGVSGIQNYDNEIKKHKENIIYFYNVVYQRISGNLILKSDILLSNSLLLSNSQLLIDKLPEKINNKIKDILYSYIPKEFYNSQSLIYQNLSLKNFCQLHQQDYNIENHETYVVIGDVHGDFLTILNILAKYNFENGCDPQNIILCGDIFDPFNNGVNVCYKKYYNSDELDYNETKKIIKYAIFSQKALMYVLFYLMFKKNIKIYWVLGNHDLNYGFLYFHSLIFYLYGVDLYFNKYCLGINDLDQKLIIASQLNYKKYSIVHECKTPTLKNNLTYQRILNCLYFLFIDQKLNVKTEYEFIDDKDFINKSMKEKADLQGLQGFKIKYNLKTEVKESVYEYIKYLATNNIEAYYETCRKCQELSKSDSRFIGFYDTVNINDNYIRNWIFQRTFFNLYLQPAQKKNRKEHIEKKFGKTISIENSDENDTLIYIMFVTKTNLNTKIKIKDETEINNITSIKSYINRQNIQNIDTSLPQVYNASNPMNFNLTDLTQIFIKEDSDKNIDDKINLIISRDLYSILFSFLFQQPPEIDGKYDKANKINISPYIYGHEYDDKKLNKFNISLFNVSENKNYIEFKGLYTDQLKYNEDIERTDKEKLQNICLDYTTSYFKTNSTGISYLRLKKKNEISCEFNDVLGYINNMNGDKKYYNIYDSFDIYTLLNEDRYYIDFENSLIKYLLSGYIQQLFV